MYQVGDAVGDDAGLARSGAGQDQERPLAVQHGLFLGRVEVFEEIHESVLAPRAGSVKGKGAEQPTGGPRGSRLLTLSALFIVIW